MSKYPIHLYNPTHAAHPTHPTQTSDKQALEFILTHFQQYGLPPQDFDQDHGRTVKYSVNDKPEALARFKQANQLDCA